MISVIGNAFPREFSRMTRLALQGDFANALTIHHRFTELFDLLFVDGNPAGVKSMLNAMGMIEINFDCRWFRLELRHLRQYVKS